MAWGLSWKDIIKDEIGVFINSYFFVFYIYYKRIDMTLLELIHTIKEIALKQPNVRTFGEGNIYDMLNANSSIEYDCVITTQGVHSTSGEFNNFNLNLFYVSRLEGNLEDNRLQIQSIGIEVLNNILKILEDVYDVEFNNLTFNTFTERFADETAGVYCTVTLITEKEIYCGEDY